MTDMESYSHWGMHPKPPKKAGNKLDLSKPQYEVAVSYDANRLHGDLRVVWQDYKFGPYLP